MLAVAVVAGGGSASELGLVLSATMAARLAGTLLGGVWADRLAPGRIMVVSDLVRALSALATAGYFASGQDSLALLCGLAAVTGGAAAFCQAARRSRDFSRISRMLSSNGLGR